MGAIGSYVGGSTFLRWWPRALVGLSVWVLVIGWSRSLQWATLLAVAAYVHARWLPCSFTVLDEGVALEFPFGRKRFLPKQAITIRLEMVGAIALVGRRRMGYPLMDRVLYEPGREALLYTAFSSMGYRVTAH